MIFGRPSRVRDVTIAVTRDNRDVTDTAGPPIAHAPTMSPSMTAQSVNDRVTITVPADGAYLALLRMVTAGLAARLDFNVDEIEDFKIAVDEACAMLLATSVAGAEFRVGFTVDANTLAIAVSVPTTDGLEPSRDTFSWTVLTALAGDVDARVDTEKVVTVTMRKARSGAG
jgi:serine/threonine-protein kinase RsbW